jgi:hypothetical protein
LLKAFRLAGVVPFSWIDLLSVSVRVAVIGALDFVQLVLLDDVM